MCTGNGRFIKIFESMMSWEWYDDPATKAVFLHFLLTARWQDGSWHGIEIKRGELLQSIASIAEQNGLTMRNVRTAISHLIDTKSITVRKVGKYSIYKVCEYEKFQMRQDNRHDSDKEVTRNRHDSDKEVTPLIEKIEKIEGQKEQKDRKEKPLTESNDSVSRSDLEIASAKAEEPEAAVEAIPLTNGSEWRPTVGEYEEYTRLYPGVDIAAAFRSMRGWSLANPTKRKTPAGVKRFVNTWLSKEQDRGSREPPRRRQTADDTIAMIWGA